MRKSIQKLASNTRGATAVEFAVLALPFFALIIGTIQLGIIFLANQTLDEAVDVAAREIQTGQITQTGGTLSDFRRDVCDRVTLISDCENQMLLSVQSFVDFDAVDQAQTAGDLYTPNGRPVIVDGTFEPGQGGEIVVVSASVFIPIVAGDVLPGVSGNGLQLSTSLAFQNELFSD
ncbi:MAG: TadE/TadG family type IV pilus assembly protein [Hyphomicrobiales bacterium]